MKVDGRCHCGNITYTAEIDPETVAICHCTDCQTLSGSAFRTIVPGPAKGFELRSGTLKIYVKTAESGNPRAQAFCPDCGTPIYSAAPKDPPFYSLRVGAIVQRGELKPKAQSWCRSALGWLPELGGRKNEKAAPPPPK